MNTVPAPAAKSLKTPRTERGRVTLRKLLDAASAEFGEKGFHEASISGITRRAGTALGSFYTYFDSKDEVFRALVNDLSDQVRVASAGAVSVEMSPMEIERAVIGAFLEFTRQHKEIYRIVDEAEFVDPASYRLHYETTAQRILARLTRGAEQGEFRAGLTEAHAWALMGMNVFLGLRYCVWSDDTKIEDVRDLALSILESGIAAPKD